MHPSVSVYQIGCVLAMSMLRASIRTRRFDESKDMANIPASGSNGSVVKEDDASNDHDWLSAPEEGLTGTSSITLLSRWLEIKWVRAY